LDYRINYGPYITQNVYLSFIIVNFRFLDSRMLATCSDDTTIALWDVRNLKESIRVLRGHCNWVKSIEYSVNDNLLISSGFDGQIYTWNINR